MSFKATFLPSGRSCAVEANDTVLAACLRAGFTPAYGCSNGNCGACRARLASGRIVPVRHHDYALSSREKLDGTFLMCAYRPSTDIEIEAEVTRGPEDIPQQDSATRVKAVDPLDSQVMRLHVQTPRSQRLRFISGQSVDLALDGEVRTRLAIASCPCDDRNLFFHVPANPDDGFSERVFSGALSPRDTLRVQGPATGGFYLDESSTRPVLMLCWHTGFAPVMSLIEHALSLETDQEIHLFRFSPTPDRQYLPHLGRSWADAYDTVQAALMPERISLLSPVLDCARAMQGIAARYRDLSGHDAYVAGPPNFVDAARQVLGDHGLPGERIKTHVDWIGALA